jgi:ligand-binding sensor domain-containing protein/signal transduction histidine kinase/DNA-binding response OmpR family regulator
MDRSFFMYLWRFALPVFLVFVFSWTARAQFQPKNLIKHYNLKDGLSQGVVNSVVQDDESLIWFGTEDGLNRFDGYSFKVFKHDPQKKNGLPDNFIQSLFKDSDGTLWISSRKGLLKFDPNVESFTLFNHKNPKTNASNDVSFITEGSSKNLWLAWYGNGFASFDRKSKTFTPYDSSSSFNLSSNRTMSLLEDKLGILWVGTQDGGLNVFKVSNGNIVSKIDALSNTAHLPSLNVHAIVEDNANNIWIGTSKGLVVYLRRLNKFYTFNSPAFSVAEKSIFSLSVDKNENLWIGTQGSGLYQLDLRQMITRPVEDFIFSRIASLDDFDISKKTILSFYEDRNKNIWVGTFGDGIYMISNEKEKFIKIQQALYRESTVSLVSYYGMCYDHDGNLWLGTDGNGLYKKGLFGSDIKRFTADGKRGSIGDNAVISALCDSKGRLWFGTYSQGIYCYERNSDSFVHFKFKGDPKKMGGNDVRVIFEDAKKNIWVGTNRGGLCLIDHQTQTYSNRKNFKGILSNGDIRSMIEDKEGNLWLGFYGDGLYRYNDGKNEITPFFHERDPRGQLQNDIVFSLNTDRQGKLWIGTGGGGLYYYDVEKDSLRSFTEKNGLSNNTVYSILIDNKGNCWISTNAGVSKFDVAEEKFTRYEVLDGLQEGQFNPGSGLYNYVAGYMCFGGTQGANIFYPDQTNDQMTKPKVMISGLQIFNKPISINDSIDGEPVLRQVMNRTKKIVLSHDQSVITLEFVGLSYSYPEKNNYAYKLDGLDDDWNFVGHQRTATYRYLKPGGYTFKVKASNQENVWGDDYVSLVIVINPPLWKTPLAYTLYLVFSVVFGLLIFRFTRKQYSLRKRLKIEKAHRKSERRLAMEKLTFFTEVSHEFRTPLTLIMGPLEDMLSGEASDSPNGRKLRMVYRNANKLLTLINKLIDYRKIESGNVLLKIKEENVVSFIEEIYLTFKDLAAKKNIRFEFLPDQPVVKLWFDKEKMEMVLNNIISNAFKYIGSGNEIVITSSVQISDKYPQGRFVIKIRDNGIGIPKKHMGSIFEWFYKGNTSGLMNSGIGLSLARKIVHLHKGDIFVESIEEKGTLFSVKVPMGKDHFKPEEVIYSAEEVTEETKAEIVEVVDNYDEEHGTRKGFNSILIVEDEEEIRAFLKDYFGDDYKIYETADGKEGLASALTFHPDLIISDIMMPGIDGMELCRQLKNNVRTSHIPIILLTAKTSLSDHKEGIGIGADAFITKPFSPEMLSLTVSNLLQSRDNLKRFYRNLFMNESGTEVKEADSPDEKFLHSIYELVKSNLDKQDFNINELSDILNMSRSLVYKKVKMLTGLSPIEYVRSLRMQEAAKLLRSQQYKVFEVVYMVGFSDAKYFRTCFAKEFGVSPSDFMKNAQLQAGIDSNNMA